MALSVLTRRAVTGFNAVRYPSLRYNNYRTLILPGRKNKRPGSAYLIHVNRTLEPISKSMHWGSNEIPGHTR